MAHLDARCATLDKKHIVCQQKDITDIVGNAANFTLQLDLQRGPNGGHVVIPLGPYEGSLVRFDVELRRGDKCMGNPPPFELVWFLD